MNPHRTLIRQAIVNLIRKALTIGCKTEAATIEYHLLDKVAAMFETEVTTE